MLKLQSRCFSTSCANLIRRRWEMSPQQDPFSKKWDFKALNMHNKRHLREHKKLIFRKFEDTHPDYKDVPKHTYGTRSTGIRHPHGWEHVPELVPELVVPDLKDCNLKPYVSYRTKDIYQEELTAKDLFNVIYGKKILRDYKEGKLDEKGQSLEPSEEEQLTAEEARIKARKTGSDIFLGGVEKTKLWDLNIERHPSPKT